jgi:hypothetical protein
MKGNLVLLWLWLAVFLECKYAYKLSSRAIPKVDFLRTSHEDFSVVLLATSHRPLVSFEKFLVSPQFGGFLEGGLHAISGYIS